MDKILSVKNLTVSFKDNKTKALDNISFDLYPGDVMAIDGLNGSGKTTLLKLITGQFDKFIIHSGEIIYYPFSDKSITSFSNKEMLDYLSSIGYVPQRDPYEGLNKLNISDLIDNAIYDSKISKNEAIELFNRYFHSFPRIKLNSVPEKLSGGEQRMVSIFLGLVCRSQTKLMIIDEPLNNLDFENVMKVSDLLNDIHRNNMDGSILLITHCKIITCINRQRKMQKGCMDQEDTKYECHHCMGEPDCELYYHNPKNDSSA